MLGTNCIVPDGIEMTTEEVHLPEGEEALQSQGYGGRVLQGHVSGRQQDAPEAVQRAMLLDTRPLVTCSGQSQLPAALAPSRFLLPCSLPQSPSFSRQQGTDRSTQLVQVT